MRQIDTSHMFEANIHYFGRYPAILFGVFVGFVLDHEVISDFKTTKFLSTQDLWWFEAFEAGLARGRLASRVSNLRSTAIRANIDNV